MQTPNDSPELIQCIYASAATEHFDHQDLIELLEKARSNNAKVDVTGMLLYHEQSFFQVLEGETNRVHQIYNRIKDDPKHTQVIKLIVEPISERHFADWSMGYAGIDQEDLRRVSGLNDFYSSKKCFTELEAGRARQLLEQFRAGCWRQRLEDTPEAIPQDAYGLF